MIQFLNNLRNKLAHSCAGLFAAPYLPDGLMTFELVLLGASLALVFLGQPLAYWQNPALGKSELPFLQSLLTAGPVAFCAAALAYFLLAWALTGLLTRRVALIAWLSISSIHLAHLLDRCAQLFPLPKDVSSAAALLSLAEKALTALILGITLSLLLLGRKPAPVSPAKSRRQIKAWQWGVSFIGLLALVGGGFWIVFTQTPGWRQITPLHSPGKRTQAALVYNPVTQKALLFGGGSEWLGNSWNLLNDLWEWDGNDWTQIVIPSGTENSKVPDVRFSHAMAFDEQRNVVVLFGGEGKLGYLNDTWEWDGTKWKQSFTPGPSTRRGAIMYYDPNLSKVVLAGGYAGLTKSGEGIFYRDTWTWDGQTWTEIKGKEPNPYFSGGSAAFDSSSGRSVLMNYNGVWNWTTDHWVASNDPVEPSNRKDTRLVSLPFGGIALFGGDADQKDLNDLWIYRSKGWENPTSLISPTARTGHVSFYDAVRSTLVIYSGYADQEGGTLNDMWEYPLKP